ncbi:MAG TPA: Smr/MutS family protein [Candidatus Binataceae bacterium]|nr:Smr/MutS family protein [Candidatus Binataceae bacterium]
MKKRKKPPAQNLRRAAPKPVFGSPFKNLKKMLAERADLPSSPSKKHAPPEAPSPEPVAAEDEAALLRDALAGVRPLKDEGRLRLPVEPVLNRQVVSEDDEVLAQLSDLVSGQGPFDITETEEYVEGMRVGLDPRLLARLRRGELSVQSHIDLHGMVQGDAHAALTQFIIESVRKGYRTILVVHGRGLRSPGGEPVLKRAAARWLSHGQIGGHVLAFATARPTDGGGGAMYVLLRRDRRRAAFDVLEGTKRRD